MTEVEAFCADELTLDPAHAEHEMGLALEKMRCQHVTVAQYDEAEKDLNYWLDRWAVHRARSSHAL